MTKERFAFFFPTFPALFAKNNEAKLPRKWAVLPGNPSCSAPYLAAVLTAAQQCCPTILQLEAGFRAVPGSQGSHQLVFRGKADVNWEQISAVGRTHFIGRFYFLIWLAKLSYNHSLINFHFIFQKEKKNKSSSQHISDLSHRQRLVKLTMAGMQNIGQWEHSIWILGQVKSSTRVAVPS